MKQNLQKKLERYTKSISQQSIDPAKIKKIGLTSAAAMAAMVSAPVELNSQVVCGNQGTPTRTVGSCVDDLGGGFGYTNYCAKFDFDGDGINELQIRYYNYNGVYPAASMYTDPIGGTQIWEVNIDTYFGGASFPENAVANYHAYLSHHADKIHIVPLSSGAGYGFIAFDMQAWPWNNGINAHPNTGQPILIYNSALPTMWGGHSGITIADFNVTSADMTDCGNISAVLPVEFSKFEATAKEKSILLEWTTETEINNAGFAIERSMDGKDFREIAFVDGEGSSTQTVDYAFEDADINGGTYYYRLRQIDFDGRSGLSEVVSVSSKSSDLDFTLSPNPSSDHINIQLSANNEGMASIEIINISGQSLKTERVVITKGQNDIKLYINELSQGIYFVKINDGIRSTFKKLIVN